MRRGAKQKPPTEHQEQVVLCEWLDWLHIPFFSVPNGARVRPSQARRLKAEGMRPGVPDLWLPTFRIAIEMKRVGSSPSATTEEQREWIRKLSLAGWDVRVCYGADEAIDWLRGLGIEHNRVVPPSLADHARADLSASTLTRARRLAR